MKFHKYIIILLFLLIATMGVVCAEDTNHTSPDTLSTDSEYMLEATNDNIIADGQDKTYTDLFDELENASDSITLKDNYKYNESDGEYKLLGFVSGITFTIEGNNKIID